MSHKKVLVIGLGRFGSALAEELWNTNCELLVVDKDPEAVDVHKARSSAAFVADASEPGVLENIGARDVDVAVVTSGEDFEATVLCVSQLSQMGVKIIFARAANASFSPTASMCHGRIALTVMPSCATSRASDRLNPSTAALLDAYAE